MSVVSIIKFAHNIPTCYIWSLTVEEHSFEKLQNLEISPVTLDYPISDLDAEDAEYEEEADTNEDDVADGFERDEERLDHQFEARGAVDHPERLQDFEKSQ